MINKICFLLVLLETSVVGHTAVDENYWKGPVCAALMSGSRRPYAEFGDYDRAIAKFRLSLKPFAPDIRDNPEVVIGREESRTYVKFTPPSPARQNFQFYFTNAPTDPEILSIAQRAYGIEFDAVKKENTSFMFGYTIKGRENILEHFRLTEASIKEGAEQTKRYSVAKFPIWRPANLVAAAFSAILAYRATYGYIPGLLLSYPLLKNEVGFYLSNWLGRARRTHLNGYYLHRELIKRELNAETKISNTLAYYAATISLSPDLIKVLKDDKPDSSQMHSGLEAQARIDRRAWFENLYLYIRANGPQIYLPRGTPQEAATLDDIFYYDEHGEPVYIFATRFLNDRINYPKKPRETKEWLQQLDWQKAGI